MMYTFKRETSSSYGKTWNQRSGIRSVFLLELITDLLFSLLLSMRLDRRRSISASKKNRVT